MAKKKTPAEWAQARMAKASSTYFRRMAEILYAVGGTEFNFTKSVVTVNDGGEYLVQIQHLRGPMLRLEPKEVGRE
jgi:hypothetical protein